MYSEQVMCFIWCVLGFLQIIPLSGSSWVNMLALFTWISIISACSAAQMYHDFFWNGNGSTLSFSEKFSLVCFNVLVHLEASIVLFQIQKFNKNLELDVKTWMMYPKRFWLYLLCLVSNLVVIANIVNIDYEVPELWFVVTVGLSGVLLPLPLLGADLIIGCFARQFSQQVTESFGVASLETVNIFYVPILSQYKAAKESMEYLLLAVFIIESILLTNSGYYVAKNPNFSNISLFLYITLHLTYISLVLEDCCSLLKSVLPSLR